MFRACPDDRAGAGRSLVPVRRTDAKQERGRTWALRQLSRLNGTLKDGDHVDIVGSWEFPEGGSHHVSRQLLRNILVLQAPSTNAVTSHLGSNPNEGFTVMLAMTDSQATKFWWVVNNGDWSLELRPITDPSDSREEVNNSPTNTKDGASARQWRRALGGVAR